MGVTGITFADYLGSDERNNWLLPFPYVVYKSDTVNVDRNTLYGDLFKSERLSFKLNLSGSIPVDSDDNEARRGMPDLEPILELGPSLEFTIYESRPATDRWILKLPVRSAIASDFTKIDHVGWIANPTIRYEREDYFNAGVLKMDVEIGPLFANENYHNYFYGVESRFATPNREVFDASSGFGGWRVSVGISRRVKNLWYGAFLRYFDLTEATFVDSPLIEKNNSIMGGFAIAWIFAQSHNKKTN